METGRAVVGGIAVTGVLRNSREGKRCALPLDISGGVQRHIDCQRRAS